MLLGAIYALSERRRMKPSQYRKKLAEESISMMKVLLDLMMIVEQGTLSFAVLI